MDSQQSKVIRKFLIHFLAVWMVVLNAEAREPNILSAVKKADVVRVQEGLRQGADVNKTDRRGRSPLRIAAENGNAEIVTLLLKAGAAVDVQDKRGLTALMAAAQSGFIGIINKLIDAGADLELREKDGRTARELAEAEKHALVVALFAFNVAGRKDSIEAYQNFIDNFPESDYVAHAKDLMHAIHWTIPRTKDTKEAYVDYLETFPDSPYLLLAQGRIEAMDWAEAQKYDNLYTYRNFLQNHPNSENRVAVETRIASLEQEIARSFEFYDVELTQAPQPFPGAIRMNAPVMDFVRKSELKTTQDPNQWQPPPEGHTYILAKIRTMPTFRFRIELRLVDSNGQDAQRHFLTYFGSSRAVYMGDSSDSTLAVDEDENMTLQLMWLLPLSEVATSALRVNGQVLPLSAFQ